MKKANSVKHIIKKILKVAIQFLPSNTSVGRIFKRKIGKGVFSGPFAGMKYVTSGLGGAYYPRLFGTYELELNQIIEKLCQKSFDTIVNVGAGEGYYAVGLALRNPKAKIIAFEANANGQYLIRQMAEMNGVEDGVSIRGRCNPSGLSDSLSLGRLCLVIMDVEGGEDVLLDPFTVPKLKESYILVELHDFVSKGIDTIISKRFQNTHKVTEIWSRPRTFADFPIKLSRMASLLPKKWFVNSLDEWRPERMRWFYLEPNVR